MPAHGDAVQSWAIQIDRSEALTQSSEELIIAMNDTLLFEMHHMSKKTTPGDLKVIQGVYPAGSGSEKSAARYGILLERSF
jgi:hypothetical protein